MYLIELEYIYMLRYNILNWQNWWDDRTISFSLWLSDFSVSFPSSSSKMRSLSLSLSLYLLYLPLFLSEEPLYLSNAKCISIEAHSYITQRRGSHFISTTITLHACTCVCVCVYVWVFFLSYVCVHACVKACLVSSVKGKINLLPPTDKFWSVPLAVCSSVSIQCCSHRSSIEHLAGSPGALRIEVEK